jgi:hypothetical protein
MQPEQRSLPTFQPADTVATPARVMIDDPLWWTTALKTFCSLLEAVQRRGVHVSVISSLRSKPPMIADELRRSADTFIELDDLKAAIGRTLNTVPPRAA